MFGFEVQRNLEDSQPFQSDTPLLEGGSEDVRKRTTAYWFSVGALYTLEE